MPTKQRTMICSDEEEVGFTGEIDEIEIEISSCLGTDCLLNNAISQDDSSSSAWLHESSCKDVYEDSDDDKPLILCDKIPIKSFSNHWPQMQSGRFEKLLNPRLFDQAEILRTSNDDHYKCGRLVHGTYSKGLWTKEEDGKLSELANMYGPKKWTMIARQMKGRTGKQCRERWHNHLNPKIKKTAWTRTEELIIYEAHRHFGNQWSRISQLLPGRSANAIKNYWNSSLKKRVDHADYYKKEFSLDFTEQYKEQHLNSISFLNILQQNKEKSFYKGNSCFDDGLLNTSNSSIHCPRRILKDRNLKVTEQTLQPLTIKNENIDWKYNNYTHQLQNNSAVESGFNKIPAYFTLDSKNRPNLNNCFGISSNFLWSNKKSDSVLADDVEFSEKSSSPVSSGDLSPLCSKGQFILNKPSLAALKKLKSFRDADSGSGDDSKYSSSIDGSPTGSFKPLFLTPVKFSPEFFKNMSFSNEEMFSPSSPDLSFNYIQEFDVSFKTPENLDRYLNSPNFVNNFNSEMHTPTPFKIALAEVEKQKGLLTHVPITPSFCMRDLWEIIMRENSDQLSPSYGITKRRKLNQNGDYKFSENSCVSFLKENRKENILPVKKARKALHPKWSSSKENISSNNARIQSYKKFTSQWQDIVFGRTQDQLELTEQAYKWFNSHLTSEIK